MQFNNEKRRKIASHCFLFVFLTFVILVTGMVVNSIYLDTEFSRIVSNATIFITNIIVGIGGLILTVKVKKV